jgi:hypothetical protein
MRWLKALEDENSSSKRIFADLRVPFFGLARSHIAVLNRAVPSARTDTSSKADHPNKILLTSDYF